MRLLPYSNLTQRDPSSFSYGAEMYGLFSQINTYTPNRSLLFILFSTHFPCKLHAMSAMSASKKKDQHIWRCGTTGLCKVKSFFKDFWDMHFGLLKTMFSPQNIFHSQKLYHAEKTRVNHRVAFHQTKVVAGCQKKSIK